MRKVMTRQHIFILVIAALCSSTAQAVIPKSGTFDIDNSSELTFTPIPCVSPPTVYLWPFASSDKYSTTPYKIYNLAQVSFSAGSFTVEDSNEKSGDLGIRVGNYAGSTQIFEASIFTIDFVGSGSFDVYLPEFTFGKYENIFFWVAESGATYYARSSKGAGFPDMSAAEAMAAGDEYLAGAVPEPATILLFGLGGLIIRRLKFKN
jgi:hypothetical protein